MVPQALSQAAWVLVWTVWLLGVPLVVFLLSRSRVVAITLGASFAGLFLVSVCVMAMALVGWSLPLIVQQVLLLVINCVEAFLLSVLLFAVFGDRRGTEP